MSRDRLLPTAAAAAAHDPAASDAAAYVQPPLRIDNPDALRWDDAADVVVVGFGGAGACAALEARSHGADVLVLERFLGGGATALSGGVYYGGATQHLRAAGFDDTAEAMFAYLRSEVGDAVSEATLRKFCNDSSANLEWLEGHGVPFGHRVYDGKTSYPPEDATLYYSGNERLPAYARLAPPAPRGHRVAGPGFTGAVLYRHLEQSAEAAGVRVRRQSAAVRLVVDAAGEVVGLEVRTLAPDSPAGRRHAALIRRVTRYERFFVSKVFRTADRIAAIERDHGQVIRVRARRGVVLSTGSFAFNRAMVKQYAARYVDAMPLGNLGCDGSGIRLGQSLGAAVGCMEKVSAWRSISPPAALVEGLAVNQQGRRFISEDIYLGHLGYHIAEHQGGRAWLVFDRITWKAAFRQSLPGHGHWAAFGLPILTNLLFNVKKAATPAELAQRCGIDAPALEATVRDYNAAVSHGADPLGKMARYCRTLQAGPYYALDISVGNRQFPCTSIPMGGLRVDEATGGVLDPQGRRIPRLYAAGRSAMGIPSGFYVSGTSVADCVFSGRRAGAHAAQADAASPARPALAERRLEGLRA